MPDCLALDFGASSIRLSALKLDGDGLYLRELARQANHPIKQGAGLVWDYGRLYGWLEEALSSALSSNAAYASIGADSWGVDYVLLDEAGAVLGHPVCYRDGRTKGLIETFTRHCLSARALYETTGLPPMEINTLFQLYAQSLSDPDSVRRAHRLLLTADYAHFYLSGVAAAERSLASTSQMLTLTGAWWAEAVQAVGLPRAALPEPVASGTVLGPLRGRFGRALQVIAPCAHDTQSAILAVPAMGGDWAYLSSGTWSILGIESDRPFTGADAWAEGFGNEAGHGGKFCVQSTVTGLWLLQEIARISGKSPTALAAAAETVTPFRYLIDPAHARFMAPVDMIAEIRAACQESQGSAPESLGELARCAYDSLALLYRAKLNKLAEIAGRRIACLHVVGGGSQVAFLNRLCAGTIALPVLAGPIEAASLGNGLAQLIALGEIADGDAARALVASSFPPLRFDPEPLPGLDQAVALFETLTERQDMP